MLVFSNSGLLPLEAITTMGLSVKDSTHASIGKFGTGLKYAIAGILRLGGSITIWRGLEKLSFAAVDYVVRDKTFSIIHMNEEAGEIVSSRSLGFTTDLGKHWQPWMLYRELLSNARDEGGTIVQDDDSVEFLPLPNTTHIVVECEELDEIDYKEHFLPPDHEVLFSNGDVEILSAKPFCMSYQGIEIFRGEAQAFSYNFLLEVELTEDRTVANASEAQARIAACWLSCDDEKLIKELFHAKDNAAASIWENTLNYDLTGTRLSRQFLSLSFDRLQTRKSLVGNLRSKLRKEDQERLEQVENYIPKGSSFATLAQLAPANPDWNSGASLGYQVINLNSQLARAQMLVAFWQGQAKRVLEEQRELNEAATAVAESDEVYAESPEAGDLLSKLKELLLPPVEQEEESEVQPGAALEEEEIF